MDDGQKGTMTDRLMTELAHPTSFPRCLGSEELKSDGELAFYMKIQPYTAAIKLVKRIHYSTIYGEAERSTKGRLINWCSVLKYNKLSYTCINAKEK